MHYLTKSYPLLLILLLPCLFLNASSNFLPQLDSGEQLSSDEQNAEMNNDPYVALKQEMTKLISGAQTEAMGNSNNTNNNTTVILAAEKTYRRDPLAGFNYYTGGWDYRNTHYWASLGFSAAPLFIIATVWFVLVGFSFCIAFLCCCCCCCCRAQQQKPLGYSQAAHRVALVFLTIFTIAAICGCVVLYVNQANFSNAIAYVLEFFLKKGLSIFDNLMSVMTALSSAADNTMEQFRLPPELKNNIHIVDQLMETTAAVPKLQSLATSQSIQEVLSPAGILLDIVAAVMLVLAFLGFLFSVLGLRFCVYMLAILGWILVTMAFILCGVFLVFHNAVADTCVAMDEWLQNPLGNSPVSLQLLPCMDKTTAEETLNTSRATSFYLIDVSNRYIVGVANQQFPPNAGPLYHNQSGPLVPLLCNPYNPDFTNRKCAPGEVNISDTSTVLKKHMCEVSGPDICKTEGRLTPDAYEQITSSVNVSNSLYNSGEFLVELLNCSIVLKTFSEISQDYCPNLKHYSFNTYLGMLIIASAVMCSVLFWIVYGRQRKHRDKYKNSLRHDPFAQSGNWK